MRDYKCSNGRVIKRSSNGRFRRTTFADLGIPNSAFNDGKILVCLKCGTSWKPLMKTANRECWNCGNIMVWKEK